MQAEVKIGNPTVTAGDLAHQLDAVVTMTSTNSTGVYDIRLLCQDVSSLGSCCCPG